MRHRGNVLIPTFVFHRSQEMAKRIDQHIENGMLPNCNVYMLSKLANKITSVLNGYRGLFKQGIQIGKKPFEYRRVETIERIEEIDEPAIVVCTPGFGHAGASLNLLNTWAEIEENTVIVISGYIPPESPLKLAQDKHYFKIDGERYPGPSKNCPNRTFWPCGSTGTCLTGAAAEAEANGSCSRRFQAGGSTFQADCRNNLSLHSRKK